MKVISWDILFGMGGSLYNIANAETYIGLPNFNISEMSNNYGVVGWIQDVLWCVSLGFK